MVYPKRILFMDYDNACRGQMAEAYANKFGAGKVRAYSAGAHPAQRVLIKAIVSMREENLDISNARSKQYALMLLRSFDYVVTFGRECACPFLDAETHIRLNIPDPRGLDMESFRAVRERIKTQVLKLVTYISRDTLDRRKRARDRAVLLEASF